MRIISGKYRGKKLITPPEESVIRPTTDRAKEALFNILYAKTDSETVFLDLFSGSGAMGIEALSRGVKKVFFVDKNPNSVKLIKRNLEGIQGDFEILSLDYNDALLYLFKKNVKADIIFCDPPYGEELGAEILTNIYRSKVLSVNGIIVVERNKNLSKPQSLFYKNYDTRIYALTAFEFYKTETKVAVTGTFDPFTNGHHDLVNKAYEDFDKIYIVLLINKDKLIRYPLDKRIEMINIATADKKDKIVIESFDGLAIDYCNKNDIQYILRGVRNDKDMAYELEMAEYNQKNGGITTLIMPSKNSEISSTLVKSCLDSNTDVSSLIDKKIEKILKE